MKKPSILGKNKQTQPSAIIGWREWLALPDLGIPAIKAKIDTGARTSALHTFSLEEFEADGRPMVRFRIHPLQKRKDIEIHCQAPLVERRRVKDSGGHMENRYVIETLAVLKNESWKIKVTLTNRDSMMFRMLLGRTALETRFIIDSGRSYTAGRSLAKAYPGRTRLERNP
ncbi:MAG: RimK/LysX family protein [Desulfobacterales bacterium]|jgi:hypothetical protein